MFDFVFEQLTARVERVKETTLAMRISPDMEAIHQLRVSIRRLTEATRSLERWVKRGRAKKLRARLRPVMKAAGAARNLDIAMELCMDAPVESAPAVVEALAGKRTKAAHRLVAKLLALRLEKLRPPCDPNPELPEPRALGAEILNELIPKYWAAGDAAAQAEASWEDLHQFRLATKHLRYTMELFAPVFGRAVAARLDVLKRVQTHLGNVNDCDTARGLAAIQSDPALDDWLAAKQQSEREKFLETWAEERARSRAGAAWVRYFNRQPR